MKSLPKSLTVRSQPGTSSRRPSRRFAMELGYHVALVTDATAAYGPEEMHAAHRVNGPTYAHAILNTKELIASLAHLA